MVEIFFVKNLVKFSIYSLNAQYVATCNEINKVHCNKTVKLSTNQQISNFEI